MRSILRSLRRFSPRFLRAPRVLRGHPSSPSFLRALRASVVDPRLLLHRPPTDRNAAPPPASPAWKPAAGPVRPAPRSGQTQSRRPSRPPPSILPDPQVPLSVRKGIPRLRIPAYPVRVMLTRFLQFLVFLLPRRRRNPDPHGRTSRRPADPAQKRLTPRRNPPAMTPIPAQTGPIRQERERFIPRTGPRKPAPAILSALRPLPHPLRFRHRPIPALASFGPPPCAFAPPRLCVTSLFSSRVHSYIWRRFALGFVRAVRFPVRSWIRSYNETPPRSRVHSYIRRRSPLGFVRTVQFPVRFWVRSYDPESTPFSGSLVQRLAPGPLQMASVVQPLPRLPFSPPGFVSSRRRGSAVALAKEDAASLRLRVFASSRLRVFTFTPSSILGFVRTTPDSPPTPNGFGRTTAAPLPGLTPWLRWVRPWPPSAPAALRGDRDRNVHRRDGGHSRRLRTPQAEPASPEAAPPPSAPLPGPAWRSPRP